MAAEARRFVLEERSLAGAAARLAELLPKDPGFMTSDPIWQPLVEELERRQRADRKAEFWLRDDDAVDPTPCA